MFFRNRSRRNLEETERLRKRIEHLERELSHATELAASLSEGAVLVGHDNRAVLANPAFSRFFGIEGTTDGRTLRELLGGDWLERLVDEVRRTGTRQTIKIEPPSSPTGHGLAENHAICTCTMLNTGDVVVTVRDVSDTVFLDRTRRELAANLSHEIKTPLTAIRGCAETLTDGALDDPTTARQFTRQILQQCERLHALLSDVLALARIERPRSNEGRRAVDLRQIVHDTLEALKPLADEKRVTFETSLDDAVLPEADPHTLGALCSNLVDNAVKYNRKGGRVELRLVKLESQVLLEIADTGIGIPKKSAERIFERFYRVDRGRSRAEGGTGLGLAIAKHAAESHGGWIEVESEIGRGSRFRAYLPTNPAAASS